MEFLITIAAIFFFGCLVIRFGVDYSKNTQYSKEILNELREIKEILKDAKKHHDEDGNK